MATLAEALQGLNYTGADTGYGIAAQTLGQMTPQLINPYGSTGQAIGIGLGSVLLQSLLGYQARQQSARDTLELNTLANQMNRLTTPEARTEFIGGVSDPRNQARLSTLATALTAQEMETKRKLNEAVGLETGKMKALQEFYASPEGAKVREFELQKIREEGAARRTPLEDWIAREEARKEREIAVEKEKQTGRVDLVSLRGKVKSGLQEDEQAWKTEFQRIQNDFVAAQNKFKLEYGAEMAIKKEADIAAQVKARIDAGEDPELARAQVLQASKAEIEKAAEDKRQANRLALEEVKQQNKIFAKQLDLDNPEIPAAVKTETSEAFAIANLARVLAKRVQEKISNYPELKLAQTFSTAGEGLREELKDLQDLVLRVRTGAAAPLLEQQNLGEMLVGTPESGPETVAMLLNKFADRTYGVSADRLAAAGTKTSTLIQLARNAIGTENIMELNAPSAIGAQTGSSIESDIASLKAALAKPNVTPETKAAIAAKIKELLGQ